MAAEIYRDPDLEWLDHVPAGGPRRRADTPQGTGTSCRLGKRQSTPARLREDHWAGTFQACALADPWAFVEQVLGWEARHVAGAPGGPAIPNELLVALPEHGTTLRPTWAVAELGEGRSSLAASRAHRGARN